MKILKKTVDIIFPRRCPVCDDAVDELGSLICNDCYKRLIVIDNSYCVKCGCALEDETKELCKRCSSGEQSFDAGRAVFLYDDVMKNSIYRFKYGNRKEYSEFYGYETVKLLERQIRLWKPDALIPIPVHEKKLRKRGYNQAELYAKEIGKRMGIPVLTDVLVRTENTRVQKGLLASERKNNLKKALKIEKYVVELKNVILIDDIYTTGSTISAAAEVLKQAGVENVYHIVLSTGINI